MHAANKETWNLTPETALMNTLHSRSRSALTSLAVLMSSLLLALSATAAIEIGTDYDVLNLPAMRSPLASKSWVHAITHAGDRVVAVGHRGHIIYSDDAGESWSQADVPVRSDLTTVAFTNPETGWVGGHEGVILHTSDGGKTWTKQLDGYQFNTMALQHYTSLSEQNPDNDLYPILIEEAEFALSQGADRPWYVIGFNERNEGYAAGAYGLVAVTYDGKNWTPIIEAVENHDGFNHIFASEKLGVDDYILVGERGKVWHQPVVNQPWVTISPFYGGSFYTVVSSAQGDIIVSGLRGNTFRSDDKGKSWDKITMPVSESMIGSVRLQDGRIVLVSSAGSVLLSSDAGHSFSKLSIGASWPLTDVIEVETGVLLVTGLKGVRKLDLATIAAQSKATNN